MSKKKVVSIQDRIPKLKEQRKKKANRRLVFYLSIFFLLILMIIYLQSPLSDIKTVAIKGNSFLSEEEIIEISDLEEQTNIWIINLKTIESDISKLPVVSSVKVSRKLPRTVEIELTEHKRVGYLSVDKKYHPIIGDGTTLKELEKPVGDAPLLVDFKDKEYLKKMTSELNDLPENILHIISEIHWMPTKDNKDRVYLYMNDGFLVDGTIRDFANKMEVYPAIVSQLSSGNKGIIHIGVGAYFEEFDNEVDEEKKESETQD
ncbi:MAG TPA: cell division protein FtsQ/DivIB [Virgibacillus sp.]|nr:cell division protein FtsQ/DivIB [Virgibacillus sp.]